MIFPSRLPVSWCRRVPLPALLAVLGACTPPPISVISLNSVNGASGAGVGAPVAVGRPAPPAPAAPPARAPVLRPVGAMSGEPQRLVFTASVNPDCSSAGEVRLTVFAAPAHGSVAFHPMQGFASFAPANPRSRCNDRRVPGEEVLYTSEAGYHGPDRFVVTEVFPDGALARLPFVVEVQ